MASLLRELKTLIRRHLTIARDVVGYDLAAMSLIAKISQQRKQNFSVGDTSAPVDIWAGMGLGSDVAAALQSSKRKR